MEDILRKVLLFRTDKGLFSVIAKWFLVDFLGGTFNFMVTLKS